MKRTIPLIAFIACSSLAMEPQEKAQLPAWQLHNQIEQLFETIDPDLEMLSSWHVGLSAYTFEKPIGHSKKRQIAYLKSKDDKYITVTFYCKDVATTEKIFAEIVRIATQESQ